MTRALRLPALARALFLVFLVGDVAMAKIRLEELPLNPYGSARAVAVIKPSGVEITLRGTRSQALQASAEVVFSDPAAGVPSPLAISQYWGNDVLVDGATYVVILEETAEGEWTILQFEAVAATSAVDRAKVVRRALDAE